MNVILFTHLEVGVRQLSHEKYQSVWAAQNHKTELKITVTFTPRQMQTPTPMHSLSPKV